MHEALVGSYFRGNKLSTLKSFLDFVVVILSLEVKPKVGSSEEREKMEVAQLQRRWLDLTASLFGDGFLDEQFTQLQQLQDESNPDFVFEVVSLFFQDSDKLLADLGRVLEQQVVDFGRVDAHVHQLKGSSARELERILLSNIFVIGFVRKGQRSRLLFLSVNYPSHCIGAQRVKNVCLAFRNDCQEGNREGCLRCLQQVKQECSYVKGKLDTLFKLEQQILAAGGSIPII